MPEAEPRRLISIIIPVYNEEDIIENFLDTLSAHLAGIAAEREIIVVDDGSIDATWKRLCQLADKDSCISLIRFSRNFGKEAAILGGLDQCRGDAAIIMDADLQHPPSLLKEMVNTWARGQVDIVDGVKVDNHSGSTMNRLTSVGFNRLFRQFTGYDMAGASDYKLLDRRVIDVLKELSDYNLFFRGTTQWLGFRHRKLQFQVEKRAQGGSKWSALSRLQLATTAITSFTSVPLHLMTLIGIISMMFAIALGLQTLYMKFNGAAVEGFTTVIILILVFGSMITLGLGIIGAYLSKIHDEVRGRPRYLIEESRGTSTGND